LQTGDGSRFAKKQTNVRSVGRNLFTDVVVINYNCLPEVQSMPRKPRQKSPTGIYHVMVRGINKENIVRDDQDRRQIVKTVWKVKEKHGFELYAYCLMDNHIHLLMKEKEEPVQKTISRLLISYANYFNWKYDRVGHLCQDRFRSEIIANEASLLNCLRYIHNNPVKAGLVKSPHDYPWCSYPLYFQPETPIIDKDYILNYFSEDAAVALEEFRQFSSGQTSEEFIEVTEQDPANRFSEANAMVDAILFRYNLNICKLRQAPPHSRSRVIREIKASTDISARELSELLGIGIHKIYRA
jgi:putative transposase